MHDALRACASYRSVYLRAIRASADRVFAGQDDMGPLCSIAIDVKRLLRYFVRSVFTSDQASGSDAVSYIHPVRPDAIAVLVSDIARRAGCNWNIVGVFADPQGQIVVLYDPASGRTHPVCLNEEADLPSMRRDIERQIRKLIRVHV